MGVLRYKIWSDLWNNKWRTIQVVLIIGIGAAAIGVILTTRNLVIPMMEQMWQSIHPATIMLFVNPPIDEDSIIVLGNDPSVKEIEGLSNAIIEWRLNPQDEWKAGGLTAREDYHDQKLNLLELVAGEWPRDKAMVVSMDAETAFGIPRDGQVFLRVDNREYKVPIRGLVYDMNVAPVYFGGTAQFYATPEEYERLVGNSDFSQVMVTIKEAYSEKVAGEVGDRLQNKLEKQNVESSRWVRDPSEHYFQSAMDGIFILLGVLGVLALVLGLLLVYNTINALISQQVDQIGVMKAIGARSGLILRLYLTMIIIYGLLALAFALPIAIFGGWGLTSWLINSFGADPGEFQISQLAVITTAVIAMVAPLLAALVPIFGGVRITVREAISSYGLSGKTGLLERLLARVKLLSRLMLLTISNTFRHKRRVFLLQIALVLSGLMFIMIVAVRDSVVYTFKDVLFSVLNADVTFMLEDPERIDYVEEITRARPEVKAVEMWGIASATIRPADTEATEDDESASMFGVPLPTQTYGYQLRAGRWLTPDDTYAIVLNQQLADDVKVGVGDWVTVKYGDKKERDFQVVGLVFDPINSNSANVRREVLLRDLGNVGRARAVWIQMKNPGLENERTFAKEMREYYKENSVDVSPQPGIFGFGGDSTTETGNSFVNQFNFIIVLLGIMAIVIGFVGGIALSGALTLSVLERRKEIGVMRAIGASSWSIFRLFIGEALILGWLSWLIALPLSIPASQAMLKALGSAFQFDMLYKPSPTGAILWFFIITVLSILASILPARGATHISVRESLAYQ